MNDPTNSRYRYLNFKDYPPYRRYIQNDQQLNQYTTPSQESKKPAHGTYGALLFHPKWKTRREEILKRDFHQCIICSNRESLQIHHRQYHFVIKENKFKLPWEYNDNLLITLCESCHRRGHSKYNVPIINI